MTKRTASLFVLTLLIVAMFAMVTEAARIQDEIAERVKAFSMMTEDPTTSSTSSKGTVGTALGAYSADGASPGYIVFRSYNDHPIWYDAGHMIDWRHSAKIQMVYMAQAIGGDDELIAARWPHHNKFDATVSPGGVFINGPSGVPMYTGPFARTGGEVQLDVDNLGNMIATAHSYIPVAAGETGNQRTAEIFWDVGGTATFVGDTVPQSLSQNPDGTVGYPFIEYQENGGTFVTHVLATEFSPVRASTYWRRVGGPPTLQGWSTPLQIPETGGGNAKITASRASQKVAIVYLGDLDPAEAGSMPFMVLSTDMGASWGSIIEVVDFDYASDGFSGWVDVACMYDSDDFLHIIYNSFGYVAANGAQDNSVNPTRIFHWTDRVAGPHSGGSLSIVAHVEYIPYSSVCGRGWTNEANTARQVIGECGDRLYVLWQQFGDPEFGDSTDCVDETLSMFTGGANSDIMMSVSLSRDGSLWDRRRNVTNSHTPACDGTTGNECSSDQYPSVARYGMSVASMGTSYWSSVPEVMDVRAALAPSFADDSTYLDLMFVDDAFPGNTRWSPADPQVWTNNPIKWVRLPCVDPIIEPSINLLGTSYLYPLDWVKSGTQDVVTLTVENLGNATLNVSSITVTPIDAPGGAVTMSSATMTVPPAATQDVDVTINPGGFINPSIGTTVIVHATVDFASDDPNRPVVSYLINTVVTDSVVQVVWDTIATDQGYGIVLSNHGNAGLVGLGNVNLDFVNSGEECTALDSLVYTEDVYIYSATPLIMQSSTNFSWNPFYSVFDPKPYNFQPVANAVESDISQNQYMTGSFVTSDSAIGFVKTTMVPKAGFTNPGEGYMVEQWKIYSADGGNHTNVRIGAWMDWDIPSDTGSNNEGGTAEADDYVWMKGREYNPGTDCTDSDDRFGASGLLGYYTTSEYAGDPGVNHTGLAGAWVHLDDDEFESGTDSMIVDSVWEWLNRTTFSANNSTPEDQQIMLNYGGFDINAGDTLVIFTVHASVYSGSEASLAALIAEAKVWYMAERDGFGTFGCCGAFTGGFPGNTNCDIEGKRNLADITKLIDHVYISKLDLCCNENGNVNADIEGKRNLADITKLIDHVYISKLPTPPCL